MGSLQQICLRWNNHQSNFPKVFDELLKSKDLVDVTLTCEGQSLDAHKVVLSACSPYFRKLFQNNTCKHPIVFMRDVKYTELESIIEFMYRGEVNVAREDLTDFLRTAQALQIKGLAEEKAASDNVNSRLPQPSVSQPTKEQLRPNASSSLPALTPLQPVQNSHSLTQPSAAKKPRLLPPSSASSTPVSKPSTIQTTPMHTEGSRSPLTSRQSDQQNNNSVERLVKLEMNEDEEDDESRDEASGEEQQGLDMLMESTLETGDENYEVNDGTDGMFSHGLSKSEADSGGELSQLGASTSGVTSQLLQGEGSSDWYPADRYRGIWTEQEIGMLVQQWALPEVQELLQSKMRNSMVYENIALELCKYGFQKSPAQCRVKMKKLKSEYYAQRKKNITNFEGKFSTYLETIHEAMQCDQEYGADD